MKKILFLLSFLFLLYSNNYAQDMPENIIQNFFHKYKIDGVEIALDYIFSTNKWISNSSTDQIQNLKLKLSNAIKLLGEYHGHELISSVEAGNSLKLYTYLIKYDRQPLRFSILLYKANEDWRLQNFQFDDGLEEELSKNSKIHSNVKN